MVFFVTKTKDVSAGQKNDERYVGKEPIVIADLTTNQSKYHKRFAEMQFRAGALAETFSSVVREWRGACQIEYIRPFLLALESTGPDEVGGGGKGGIGLASGDAKRSDKKSERWLLCEKMLQPEVGSTEYLKVG